jgi:hypothetical protein
MRIPLYNLRTPLTNPPPETVRETEHLKIRRPRRTGPLLFTPTLACNYNIKNTRKLKIYTLRFHFRAQTTRTLPIFKSISDCI